jgi:hypothetical protein
MSTRIEIYKRINENAAEINRLHRRVQETFNRRGESKEANRDWLRACEEMRSKYGALCVPGGLHEDFYSRILAGDPQAVEVALCFLEVRPYFTRSGYMWKDILRRCKRAPLSGEQAERRDFIVARHAQWQSLRRASSDRGAEVRRRLQWLVDRLLFIFPVGHSDQSFDGIETAFDLYKMLCKELMIDAIENPEQLSGTVRPTQKFFPPRVMAVWAKEYRAWRESEWTAADVWATLVAEIKDARGLKEADVVSPATRLWD